MKMKKDKYRVLVLDDNPDVLKGLLVNERLSSKHEIGGSPWFVEIVAVSIELVADTQGHAHISDKSINQILAAGAKPFDLVLADYGFANSKQYEDLASGKVTTEDFLKQTRTAADIVQEIEDYWFPDVCNGY